MSSSETFSAKPTFQTRPTGGAEDVGTTGSEEIEGGVVTAAGLESEDFPHAGIRRSSRIPSEARAPFIGR
jgi:hypothetical protein